jgi:hypothetical protein
MSGLSVLHWFVPVLNAEGGGCRTAAGRPSYVLLARLTEFRRTAAAGVSGSQSLAWFMMVEHLPVHLLSAPHRRRLKGIISAAQQGCTSVKVVPVRQ